MAIRKTRPLFDKYLLARHADITAATASAYAAVHGAGSLIGVKIVSEAAISTADETLTVYQNGVTTGYTITVVQSGSAAGTVDEVVIGDGAVVVTQDDVLSLVSSNASSGGCAAAVTYIVREV